VLSPFAAGGTPGAVPFQERGTTVVVLMLPDEGEAAKESIASKTPMQERAKAKKRRGLRRPDSEEAFLFIMI
jgi:hypothetical protein